MRQLLLAVGLSGLVATACAHGGPSAPPRKRVEFVPLPDMETVFVANPHDLNGTPFCQRCHTPGEERPAVDPISLCSQCHDVTAMKHPWRVEQPGGAGPLPLMEGKDIACHTCHDPHDVKKFPHGLRAEYTALCLNCHRRH